VIDRAALEIRGARAQLGNVAIGPVQVGIKSLNEPVLTVDGAARGPLAEMLRFVNGSPVGGWTSQALARASGTGNADLKLAMSLPLQKLAASTVKGSVVLAGNDVRITPDTPLLASARGRVDFSHKGFSVVGASARVLGGDATFDGGTQPDGSLRFSGQGTASAEGLRRATEFGPLARLAGAMSGQAPHRHRGLAPAPRAARRRRQPPPPLARAVLPLPLLRLGHVHAQAEPQRPLRLPPRVLHRHRPRDVRGEALRPAREDEGERRRRGVGRERWPSRHWRWSVWLRLLSPLLSAGTPLTHSRLALDLHWS